MLPFRWSEDQAWQATAQRGPDDRRPRYDTPQYQTDEDRRRAASACNACDAAAVERPGQRHEGARLVSLAEIPVQLRERHTSTETSLAKLARQLRAQH